MKALRYLVLTVIVVFFAGCYEVTEEIVINDKGSGTYVTKLDMSALLEMMQTMAGPDELAKEGLDRAIDTTISMQSAVDSSHDMSSQQKALFKDGVMRLKMDIRKKIFKADIRFPFDSFQELQTLMSGAGSAGLAEVFKKVYGSDSATTSAPPADQGLDQLNNIFDVSIEKGRISKRLNDEKYKALLDKPEIAQAKQMAGAGMEILYTTVISFPRPVKKSDNPLIKLSSDKKTATIKYNLLSIFDAPEIFSYTISY